MAPRFTLFVIALALGCFAMCGSILTAAAPAAPSDFYIGLQNISGTNRFYFFTWRDNSDNETEFRLEYKVNSGSFSILTTSPGSSDPEYAIRSLSGSINDWAIGTVVQFRLGAYNTDGTSYSNTITLTMAANTFAAPTALSTTPISDSQIRLQWSDASNVDDGVEIEMRRIGDSEFEPLADWDFRWAPYVNITQLIASTSYEFRLRAFKQIASSSREYTGYSSIVTGTTLAFSGVPTGLAVSATNETTIQLAWQDPFASESGFEIQYGVKPTSGPTTFEVLGTVGANVTSTTPIPGWTPGITYDFRIRAISSANGTPTYSGFSNVVTFTVPFYKPSNLAVTSITHSTTTLTWQDNSLVESGYEVLVRAAGESQFEQWVSTGANQTSITVNDLPSGLPIEFAVRAFHEFPVGNQVYYSFSDISNVATGTTKDWFYTRLQLGGTSGQAFNYTLATTSISPRTTWSVSNLPAGLTFNQGTGIISGTLQSKGVFVCPISATFANGWVAQDNLIIRVIPSPAPPVIIATPGASRIKRGEQFGIDLSTAYQDADTESAVRVSTNLGSFDMVLYDSATPQTVANFLSYVNDPDASDNYSNSVMHRSVPNFVIQGGGYKSVTANQFNAIPTKPSPLNEPGFTNVRGTVAMAKLGNNPNSATNQFFVNLGNNASNLDAQNGGFTVFGRVAGSMSVPDAIAALPRSTLNATVNGQPASFEDFPRTTGNPQNNVSIISITQIPALSFAVTANSDPTIADALISDGTLQLVGYNAGTCEITYTVTDLDGNALTRQIMVTVEETLGQWLLYSGLPYADQAATADPDHDGLTNLEEFAFMGNAAVSNSVGILPELVMVDDNGITRQGIKFRMRKFASNVDYIVQSSGDLLATSWQNVWSWNSGSGPPAASGINSPLMLQEFTDHYEITIMDDKDLGATNRGFLRVKLSTDTPPTPQPN